MQIEENIKEFQWQGLTFRTAEQGDAIIHPDKHYTYYNKDCVFINSKGELELTIKRIPKLVEYWDGRSFIPYYATGLVRCTSRYFLYGEVEFEAKLPIGTNLWSALWMWSLTGWPPEIDVMEAWTTVGNGYYKFPLHYRITTNFSSPSFNNPMQNGEHLKLWDIPAPTKHFIRYKLIRQPDKFVFYANKKLIRRVTDETILNHMRDKQMCVIMNIHPTIEFNDKDLDIKQNLIIKSIKINNYDTNK